MRWTRQVVGGRSTILTPPFIHGSRRSSDPARRSRAQEVTAMTDPKHSQPSLWAVALLVVSAALAVISMALVSTGYGAF
jgi:hypothetical protein